MCVCISVTAQHSSDYFVSNSGILRLWVTLHLTMHCFGVWLLINLISVGFGQCCFCNMKTHLRKVKH